MRVSACPQKAPSLYRGIRKRRPMNSPRLHRLVNGQLSSHYAPLPSISALAAAPVIMCCSDRPASSSAPSVVPEVRMVGKYDVHCLIL